jgi:hypothetical protein
MIISHCHLSAKNSKKFGFFNIITYFCSIKAKDMEDKRYPEIEEEEGIGMCCEPEPGYAATGSGYANTMGVRDMISDDFDPGIGPYTKEELNARIDEAEEFIAQAEKGDWSNWVTEEQSRANLYSKYPWLR